MASHRCNTRRPGSVGRLLAALACATALAASAANVAQANASTVIHADDVQWEPSATLFWTVNQSAIMGLFQITHHWLDSTHITFGVLTAGAVVDHIKVEVSAFRGREPDQDRWNIESPKLDSHSFRVSVNPTDHWALQASSAGMRIGRKPAAHALMVFQPGVLNAGDNGHIAYTPWLYEVSYRTLPASAAKLARVRFIC